MIITGLLALLAKLPGSKPNQWVEPVESACDLRQYLGDALVVRWELVAELPCEPSGKFLFSRSTVTPAFLSAAPRDGAAA